MKILPHAVLAVLLALATACDRGARPAQTGKPAPEFTLSDGSTQIRLADYRGRVVLLNFWATWCPPCVAEMPSLLALQRAHPDLAVLAISVDQDEAAYKRFIAARHIDLLTVRDPRESVATLYQTKAWPESYLIDRQGVIRRKFVGAQDWNSPEIGNFLKNL